MFAVNMDLDHLILRPIAQTYNFITPQFVQTGVTNVFHNLDEVTSVPNDIFQGKFLFMFNDFWRFAINSTIGIGGLFDVAKHMGLRPHYETFNLTLAYWEGGKTDSPYLVLPFLGVGNFRKAFGEIMDLPTTPYVYIPWKYWYYSVGARGVYIVNYRSSLLPANRLVDDAFDPYVFVRSAFTQTMDRVYAANQIETYKSKHITSFNRMTTGDFEAAEAENAPGAHSETGSGPTGLASGGINEKKAADSGFVFDEEPTAKKASSKTTKPAAKSQ